MLPDRVSNPGPLTYESGALPIALRGPVQVVVSLSINLTGIRKCLRNFILLDNGLARFIMRG